MSAMKEAILFLLGQHRSMDANVEYVARDLMTRVAEASECEEDIHGDASLGQQILDAVKADIQSCESELLPAFAKLAIDIGMAVGVSENDNTAAGRVFGFLQSHAEDTPAPAAVQPESPVKE